MQLKYKNTQSHTKNTRCTKTNNTKYKNTTLQKYKQYKEYNKSKIQNIPRYAGGTKTIQKYRNTKI